MTAPMGCSVSSPTNVCSDNINSGRFLGRAPGADSFATYVPGKPDAGNPPVRFDEGRELADSPRPAPAYSTPVRLFDPVRLFWGSFGALGEEAICRLFTPAPLACLWITARFDPVIGDTLSGVIGDTLIQCFSRL